MRIDRTPASLLLAVLLLGLPVPVLAAAGFVVNAERKPIEGARVCYFVDSLELICTLTDKEGRWELPVSQTDTIRAHADGYNPTTFSAVAKQGPVVLERAPVLTVRLTDGASGERIAKGEVLITYPSGKELGPFPTNKSGLRIRRGLLTGEIRLVGKAEGFRPSSPIAVQLEAGEETAVTIELAALESKQEPE
jgi:hypothetical protein